MKPWSNILGLNSTELLEALPHWFAEQDLIFLGVVAPEYPEAEPVFSSWLEDGYHGSMSYMAEHKPLRLQPSGLLPGSQATLVFCWRYGLGEKRSEALTPRVAQYARYRDYHKQLKRKASKVVERITDWLSERQHTWQYRITVDSAPVLERALAAKTTAGFIGKNTLYIHPQHGSFVLLGEIFTDLALPQDHPAQVIPDVRSPMGGCGSCQRCQVACPTGALDQAYRLDARKCLSYWTIEHRGAIDIAYWQFLPEAFFGCDICQMVCPYNRQKPLVSEQGRLMLKIREFHKVDLASVVLMEQKQYEQWFGGTPMTRAKISGLRRNALITLVVEEAEGLDVLCQKARQVACEVLQATLDQIPAYRDLYGGIR